MNQIMPVGKGVLIALEDATREQHHYLNDAWRVRFPDVPVFIITPAQIVQRDNAPLMIEFTGTDLTPTFVAEFQRWWEGVNHG